MPRLCAVLLCLSIASPALAERVSGRVLDPQGRKMEARLEVLGADGKVVKTDETNVAGDFDLELAPGRYSLVALSRFGARSRPAALDVAAGKGPSVDLRFDAAGILVVDVAGAATGPWNALITLFPQGQLPLPVVLLDASTPRAEQRVELVPPGRYAVVVANSRGVSFVDDVRLIAGSERRLSVSPAYETLRIRVRDPARAKLSKAEWADRDPDYEVVVHTQLDALLPRGLEVPDQLVPLEPRRATFERGAAPGDEFFERKELGLGPYRVTVERGDVVIAEARNVRPGKDVVIELPKK